MKRIKTLHSSSNQGAYVPRNLGGQDDHLSRTTSKYSNNSAQHPISTDSIARLPVPDRRINLKTSTYSMPVEIGCFSYGPDRGIKMQCREALGYYHCPTLGASLSEGFSDRFIKRDPASEHLDALLNCVKDANQRLQANGKAPVIPQICTWRGIMNKIAQVPYASNETWEFGVTLHKGTIYIEEHESIEKQKSKFGATDRDAMFTYWGYKFESLSTIPIPPNQLEHDDPVLKNRETAVVNTNIQFCSVFKTNYGSHSVVMGAEVDCVTREIETGTSPQSVYAELKTTQVIDTDRKRHSFEKFKLLRIWLQSYLAGVPKVIIGFRTGDGHISHVQEFDTSELPRLVRGKPGMWDPNRCIAFGDQFLAWIKQVVTIDDWNTVYTVRFDSNKQMIEMLAPVTGGDQVFIPKDFSLEK